MGTELIKNRLAKNGRSQIIIGIIVIVIGLGFIALFTSGVGDKSELSEIGEVFLWLLFGGFVVLGLIVMIKGMQLKKSVVDGSHPLINAINNGDKGFVIWFYEHMTTVNGGNPTYQILMYSIDKKCYRIGLKNESQSKEVFQLLNSCFPNAILGYTPEIANNMVQNHGIKIKK